MIVLFIHQNFPAQYRHLAQHLARQPGNTVYFITQPNGNDVPGINKLVYQKPPRDPAGCHPFVVDLDESVRNGLAVAELCRTQLRDKGVQPDIVIGHSGWGETLFVKDVFPDVPLLTYFEFFYHARGVDVGFDAEFASIFSDPSRLRIRNAVNLIGFDAADWGHTATRWQRELYPPEMRSRITALHEGVDTDDVRPDPDAWIKLARAGLTLSRKDEVITYLGRNLEPYRGFHVFMRALPEILRRRPRAQIVIVGGDGVSYGHPAPPGTTYREMMLREVGDRLDFERVHFLGQIPYAAHLNLLQVSSVHVYLTYPFVLSWSFIEALASGCLVVGSATPPVMEVLKDGENGLLVDFFSSRDIADRIDQVLDHPDRMQRLRDAARQTAITNFDLKRRQLPLWERLIGDLREGRRPPVDMM
ncbi:MAG TPA: glycosyltransferase family 4 protein [Stellaceae bacterium]|nr:glycosyltransferase family 4 protein [Stellaceae bacterium]